MGEDIPDPPGQSWENGRVGDGHTLRLTRPVSVLPQGAEPYSLDVLDAIASSATLAGILVLSVALDCGVTVELTMLQRLLDTHRSPVGGR
jgi:hypothetical protein